MSGVGGGGGLVGHLANAVRDDPIMTEWSEIAIMGANDYICAKYDSHNDFVYIVDKSIGVGGRTGQGSYHSLSSG